jgi:tRNA 2-selenouridine synthase
MMTEALEHQGATGRTEGHRDWIRSLLVEYYDPMYDYQIERNRPRVCFTGTPQEVAEEVARLQAAGRGATCP